MFKTVQQLKHKTRTSFGNSGLTFGDNYWKGLEALMGVGQETARAQLFGLLYIIFTNVLRDNGYEAIANAPFSKPELNIDVFVFVNDNISYKQV